MSEGAFAPTFLLENNGKTYKTNITQSLFIFGKGILFRLISLFLRFAKDIAALIRITFVTKKLIIPTQDPNPIAQRDI